MWFDVYEIKNDIEYPVWRMEAHDAVEALAKVLARLMPGGFKLRSLNRADGAVTRVQDRCGGTIREFAAYPARRPNP